jgi:hypothetical protein
MVVPMPRRPFKQQATSSRPAIPFRDDDLVPLREISDIVDRLYTLIRDREHSVAMACLLRPVTRRFGTFVEALEDRFRQQRTGRSSPS